MTITSGISAKFLAATALAASAALMTAFSDTADAHGGRRYNPRAVPPDYGQTYYPGYRGHGHGHHHHDRHDHGHMHGQFNVYGGIGYGGYRGGYSYRAPVYPSVPPAFAIPPIVPMPGICVTGPGFIIC